MAKFNKYDYVGFKVKAQRELNKSSHVMLVIDVEEKEDGAIYKLQDTVTAERYALQEEEWLEPVETSILKLFEPQTCGMFTDGGSLEPSEKLINETTVSILGTTYTIETRKVSEDEYMKEKHLSGYCCEESKRIVIADMSEKEYFELDEAEQKSYYKKTLRHELLHAFLNESGLSDDSSVPAGAWAKHEEMVDWFAIQSPKIYKTFAELDIL